MSLSFYDCSVATYLQTLGGVQTVLERGAVQASEADLDLSALVGYRLHEDMLPLSFQVVSVWHHSAGAMKGLKAGLFEPPPKTSGLTYSDLQGLVGEAIQELSQLDPEEVNALESQPMVFRMGSREIPFTSNNFLLSFSLPNFMFHSATVYNILRQNGVPLGKIDFLGQLRVGQ